MAAFVSRRFLLQICLPSGFKTCFTRSRSARAYRVWSTYRVAKQHFDRRRRISTREANAKRPFCSKSVCRGSMHQICLPSTSQTKFTYSRGAARVIPNGRDFVRSLLHGVRDLLSRTACKSRRLQGYKPSLEREGGFHGVEDG